MRSLFGESNEPMLATSMVGPLLKTKCVLVVDVSNIAHRCWHSPGYKNMSHNGQQTGHVYGFFRTIDSFVNASKIRPVSIVYCTDGHAAARYERYPEYKGNRDKKYDLVPEVVEVAHLMPGYTVHRDDWEADDCAGSFVRALRAREAKEGVRPAKVMLVTGDKDFEQLLDFEDVYIWTSSKSNPYGPSGIKEAQDPRHIPMMKAIHGDTSDNIFGIPYFKKKVTAAILPKMEDPLSVDEFVALAKQECSSRVYEKVLNYRRKVEDNIFLTRIRTELRLKIRKNRASESKLRGLLQDKYGCSKLDHSMRRLFGGP